jgi:V/A-type H+-transporting ATPase subunit I
MRKIRLIVLKSQTENLVKELHEAGVVDIRKAKHEGLEDGRPAPSFDGISADLLRLRSALGIMESVTPKSAYEPKLIADAITKTKSLNIDETVKKISQEMTVLSERIKTLESNEASAKRCMHFKDVDFSRLGSKTVQYRVGEVPAAKVAMLGFQLSKIDCDLISEAGKGAVLALFDNKKREQVDALLGEGGFADIELPQGMTTPAKAIEAAMKEKEAAKARGLELKKSLIDFSRVNISKVKDLIRSLEAEADRAEITNKFVGSRKVHVLEGWALDEDFPKLEPLANKHKATLEDAGFDPHQEIPPTVLDNPKIVRPFEFITKSYSLPKYHEVDPTIPYFIGLSIIYGMIIGDVGYGILSMILAHLIMKKFSKSKMMKSVGMIWLISGIPTIAWGLVFDEWFGLTHNDFLNWIGSFAGMAILQDPLYSGFHRVHELNMLILGTLFLGMIHLAAGLAIGALNEWNHSKKHAFAKLGWIVFEFGIAFYLLSALGYVGTEFSGGGIVLVAIGAVVVIATEGATGAVEIPGFAGNILSYARIAVIGVVGVILAEILNEFLKPTPAMGLMGLVLLPIYIVLHLANCVIAMFEAIVQGGRLNIFEFRTKAIQGGGNLFAPFALFVKDS